MGSHEPRRSLISRYREQLKVIDARRLAFGLFALALAIRLAFSFVVFPIFSGPLRLGFDPDNFGMLAENLFNGNGFRFNFGTGELTTYRGPAFPFLLAGGIALTGDVFVSGVVIQAIVSAAVVPVVFGIAQSLFGRSVGLGTGVIAAVHPLLIWYSPRLRYEPLLALMVSLTVYFGILLLRSPTKMRSVQMGLAAGLSALVAQISLPISLLLGVVLITATRPHWLMTKRVLLALTVATLVIAPWTVRNYLVTEGRFIPVQTGGVMEFVRGTYFVQIYPDAPLRVVEVDRAVDDRLAELLGGEYFRGDRHFEDSLRPHAVAFVRDHPGALLHGLLVQIPRFWYLSESPAKSLFLLGIQGPLLLAGAIGMISIVRRRQPGGYLIFIPILYFNVVYALFHAKARFSMPAVPLLIILAVAGMASLAGACRSDDARETTRTGDADS